MVNLSAKRVAWVLVAVALSLTILSIATQLAKNYYGRGGLWGLVPLFSVVQEESIATWYSMVALLFCSVLLATIAVAAKNAGDRYFRHWGVLSVIFLYLSADEGAAIHENMMPLGRGMLNLLGLQASGALTRAWVVPAAVIVLIVAVAYLRFFFALPRKSRLLFLAAVLLFLGGAMAMEMLAASYVNLHGGGRNMTPAQNNIRVMLPNVEELLEMLGVIVFIYALMSHISAHVKEVQVRVE